MGVKSSQELFRVTHGYSSFLVHWLVPGCNFGSKFLSSMSHITGKVLLQAPSPCPTKKLPEQDLNALVPAHWAVIYIGVFSIIAWLPEPRDFASALLSVHVHMWVWVCEYMM